MIIESQLDLDRSMSRRLGTTTKEAQVMRTAAALEANGIGMAADAAEAKLSAVGPTTDTRPIERGIK